MILDNLSRFGIFVISNPKSVDTNVEKVTDMPHVRNDTRILDPRDLLSRQYKFLNKFNFLF
jgi:hypothetical protein